MSNLKKRLLDGEQITGTMLNIIDHPDIVKILKACGFDYFIVDCEHGCIAYSQVAALIALAKEMEIGALVRIPCATRECILRYMEMGVDGLMLPNTDTADQARELVLHSKYNPLGNRGVSMMRGHNRYMPVSSPKDYMKQANDETILIVQVESATSVENINDILSLDGIDIAFIGPNDLTYNLGIPGEFDNPLYVESLEKVIAACQKQGKHCGTHGMNLDILKKWIAKGMSFNLYSNEVNMIMNDAKSLLDALKA